MDYQKRVKELKKKRHEFHVTQDVLTHQLGVEKTYISKIENGNRKASEQLLEAMEKCLEEYDPDNPLEILFDYVRIRFPTDEVKKVVEKIMHLRLEYFLHQDYAFYGYAEQYVLGDITVMVSPDKKKGILLELKGKGCRQYERYLKAQKRTWYDFLMESRSIGAVMKRIDLAINDCIGLLDVPMLAKKVKNGECISVFRSFRNYESGEMLRTRDQYKKEMGNTLYLGSMKSEIYFCVYEKDYEQYVKNGIPLEESKVKNRFEIRLKDERAELAVDDLLGKQDAGFTAFGIINRYVRFVDKKKGKKRGEWKLNEKWQRFLGMQDRVLHLTMEPEPYTFERTLRWLEKQVAPTLTVVMEVDKNNDTNVMADIMNRVKLKDHHEKLIEQQSKKVEELII